ncbi:hypothetical protein KBD49_01525 [Myxococcota bacterium]|jgi:hypothetical protein|nr:hypothetical protein [Myxococcota bacterium]
MDPAPRDLAKRLVALPHPDVRRESLRAAMRSWDGGELAHWLGFLAIRRGHRDFRPLWLDTIVHLLSDPDVLGPGRAEEAARRLETHRLRHLMEFLGVPEADRAAAEGVPPRYALEEVPLGTRKWRARGQNRDTLRLLCADPDPSVLRILLANPRITEEEALRIASRRPQVPRAFLEVLKSARFGVRETVQGALVLNPWCPVRLGLAVIPLLSRACLADIVLASGLDPRIRRVAGKIHDDPPEGNAS